MEDLNKPITFGRVVALEDGNSWRTDQAIVWADGNCSIRYPVKTAQFRLVIPDSSEHQKLNTPHCAPAKQFVLHLAGHIKIITSDGYSFLSDPGEIGTAEDIHGEGHTSVPMGTGPRLSVFLPFEDGVEL
ncbi:hypothetical protein T439DRAFT_382918 [Meredithblackwellia eburnea MCA 4105]